MPRLHSPTLRKIVARRSKFYSPCFLACLAYCNGIASATSKATKTTREQNYENDWFHSHLAAVSGVFLRRPSEALLFVPYSLHALPSLPAQKHVHHHWVINVITSCDPSTQSTITSFVLAPFTPDSIAEAFGPFFLPPLNYWTPSKQTPY